MATPIFNIDESRVAIPRDQVIGSRAPSVTLCQQSVVNELIESIEGGLFIFKRTRLICFIYKKRLFHLVLLPTSQLRIPKEQYLKLRYWVPKLII